MHRRVKSNKKKLLTCFAVIMIVIMLVVAGSFDWSGIIKNSGGGSDGPVTNPPSYEGTVQNGTIGAKETGQVADDYVPTGTALNNASFKTTFATGNANSTISYYLTENVTGFTGFNNDQNIFKGVLDGNGHSVTITAAAAGNAAAGGKSVGGIVGTLGSGAESGTIKNLTVIFSTNLSMTKTVNDEGYASVGLLAGNFRNGTLENVRVKVNSGVTITYNDGGMQAAFGGIIGQAGNISNEGTQTINRCVLEVDGTVTFQGTNWHWMGGLTGCVRSGGYAPHANLVATNFIMTGGGTFRSTGSNNLRVGGITGGWRGGNITVNGFIMDLYGTGLAGEPAVTVIQDGGSGTSNVSYWYTTRSKQFESNKSGTNTNRGTVYTSVLGEANNGGTATPSFDPENGNVVFKVTGLKANFYDLDAWLNSTRVVVAVNSQNYSQVNVSTTRVDNLTGAGYSLNVNALLPKSVNSGDPGKFFEHIKNGFSVSLDGDISVGAAAFNADVDFKGVILGNGHSITLTGISTATYGGGTQGGIVKSFSGATIADCKIIYAFGAAVSRTVSVASEADFGLIAGSAVNATVSNVQVLIKTGTSITCANSSGRDVATGGMFGVITGGAKIESSRLTIENNASLTGGSTASEWVWTGGIFGVVRTANVLTLNKVAVTGGGTLASVTSGSYTEGPRVGGIGGGIQPGVTGRITATDVVFGMKNLIGHKAKLFCYDNGAPNVSFNKVFVFDGDDIPNFTNEPTNRPSMSDVTKIFKNAFDSTDTAMQGIPVSIMVNDAFNKITLTVPKISFDENILYNLELRDAGAAVLDSQPIYKDTASYTLSADLSNHVTLGLYMKQVRSMVLPTDANMYEHGYVDSGYVQQQGYFGNLDWTEVNSNVNATQLATLSGDGKYFLSGDVSIQGFLSRSDFGGVLDGCGHTVTIISAGGAADPNVGGLFSILSGTVKNLRVVVKTSVARANMGTENFGLLAGKLAADAKLFNVKVSLAVGYKADASRTDTRKISVGGIAGRSEGTTTNPVLISGVTVEMNGEMRVSADYSTLGGLIGRTGVALTSASGMTKIKQAVFRGEAGTLTGTGNNNDDGAVAGLIGKIGEGGLTTAQTVEVDGFIFGFYGSMTTRNGFSLATCGASTNASCTLRNAYKMTGIHASTASAAWLRDFTTGKGTVTNESTVEAAFTLNGQSDISLGYSLALFDPAAINTADGTVKSEKSLVCAAIFEDGNEKDYFIAEIEIIYGSETMTGKDSVSLANFFKINHNAAYSSIRIQIRANNAGDGVADVIGDQYVSPTAPTYSDGWLTNNGRVPPMYGVPSGATMITDGNVLAKWLKGLAADNSVLDVTSVSYLYGYFSTDIMSGGQSSDLHKLAAGRTLDGNGRNYSINTGDPLGIVTNSLGWMTGATGTKTATVLGEIVTYNNGTIKNLTVAIESTRQFTQGSGANHIYGGIAGVNNGIIENCRTIINGTIKLPGGGNTSSGAIVLGGIAGVNRGTVRHCTVENNGTADLDTGNAYQKILGGVVGVNDGGLMEYLISCGNGIYQIGRSTGNAFMGGVVGLGNIGSGTLLGGAVGTGASGGLTPARGTFRYALHNFSGTFKSPGGCPGYLNYGAVGGYILTANHSGSINPAVGIYASVPDGTGWYASYRWAEASQGNTAAGTLPYDTFFSGTGNTNGGRYGGGVIKVVFNRSDDVGSVAGGNDHHFWWDYWGGSSVLKYEVRNAAAIRAMSASGTGSSVNTDTGTVNIDKNTAMTDTTPEAYGINSTFYNDGSYYDFLNTIKQYGNAPSSDFSSGTDLSSEFYSGGSTRLQGGGNFYLSRDTTIYLNNKSKGFAETFSGTFDGNGHTLTITTSSDIDATWYDDMYGFMTDSCSGTIRNVKIVYSGKFKQWNSTSGNRESYTGIIAPDFWGTLENVSVTFTPGAFLHREVNSNAGGTGKPLMHSNIGALIGNMGGGVVRNCTVDYGINGAIRAGGGGAYGFAGYRCGGLVGRMVNGTIDGVYVKGSPNITVKRSNYYDNGNMRQAAGLLVGEQTGGTVQNVYLENVIARLIQTNDESWAGMVGLLRSPNSSGTMQNIYLIGDNKIYGGNGNSYAVPTTGVVQGTFMSNSIDAMLAILKNAADLASNITNGTSGVNPSANRNFYFSYAEYKKDAFSAGYGFVLRYQELGFHIWDIKNGNTALGTGNAESTYKVATMNSSTKLPTTVSVGVRAKIDLVKKEQDADGNVVAKIATSSAISVPFTGSSVTPYEFRAVYWGNGTAGQGATQPLSWSVGGKVVSGRVPTEAPLAASMDMQSADMAFYNAAGMLKIPVNKVQFSGAVTVAVTKVGLTVTSDTGGNTPVWKDKSTLTFRLTNTGDSDWEAVDGAINQVVYSLDGGRTWANVLKCNNFQDGVASAVISTESLKGGSQLMFRAYSGVSLVSTNSNAVIVRVDTAYPVVTWDDDVPLSTSKTERILVVRDASVGDVGSPLTITGPEGHNLTAALAADWATSGKIRIRVPSVGAAKSGSYTFTVKDALNRTTSFSETLDFAEPTLHATVSTVTEGRVTAINNPEANVALSLSDNISDVAYVLNTLKVYVLPRGDTNKANALLSLSVQDGTVDISAFDTATGTGNVKLKMPEKLFNNVDVYFEVRDEAGNVASLKSLSDILIDTRVYTVNVERYQTEEQPYISNGIVYKVNGSTYIAAPGTGDILHVLQVHLFDRIDIAYSKKTGFTYDGYRVLREGDTLGTIAAGAQYILGTISADELGGVAVRNLRFLATQEIKLHIDGTAAGSGALVSGGWNNAISVYTAEGATGLPNFKNPTAKVFAYNADTDDYTREFTWILSDYFDITMTDPNGSPVAESNGILTFVTDPDDSGYFIEGLYTLQMTVKEGLRGKYTVLDGSTATLTVSSKSRRNIIFTYPDDKMTFEYMGERAVFGADGLFSAANGFGAWSVDFDPASFDDENPRIPDDDVNLAALNAGLGRLNYTLYYNGVLRGQKIGDTVTGNLSLTDVGVYNLTVSIPITGAGRFKGVTGSKSLLLTVTKKNVDVYAADVSLDYGESLDIGAYYYSGFVASDVKATDGNGNVWPSQVKDGVLSVKPNLMTEYTSVRMVNGVVSAYVGGIVITGGIAKNYNFILHNGNLTINPRKIILKINDTRKGYGESDPNLMRWALSETSVNTSNNRGFAYSDNYLSFVGTEFTRTAGEDAFGKNGSNQWAQKVYAVSGHLANQNYNVTVENGSLRIDRRELSFNTTGDQGLIYEEGVKHSVSVKIANGLTKDNLTVKPVYDFNNRGNWTDIGTHYYRLEVKQNGTEGQGGYFANYSYPAEWIPVIIGASILNIVILPQVLTYGAALSSGANWYVLEGINEADRGNVVVTLNVPKEFQGVGYHAGAIGAEVTFTGNVSYTPAIRKGNLTVLPKTVSLSWSGDFNAIYTGSSLNKRITATVSSQTSDTLQVAISFSTDGTAADPKKAGVYAATASLEGMNSQNYIINAADRSRQFIVQKSEQRIGVGPRYTYNPNESIYPGFNAVLEHSIIMGGINIYRAKISYLDLLSVMVNTATGYRPTTALIPTIKVYSLDSVDGTGSGVNAIHTLSASNGSDFFFLEAGTYNAVAELPESENYYANAYLFTFRVIDTKDRLFTSDESGNSIDSRSINGSYTATSLGQTVAINDAGKIGYTIGPNIRHRWVEVSNGSISRTMNRTYDPDGKWGASYNSSREDGYYGSHDGDWGYAYFNVSVSEEIRQLILQGKVKMKLNFTGGTQWGGVEWHKNWLGQWTYNEGCWREDTVDTTNLSYMVREIPTGSDLRADAADSTWIGLNDRPYAIGSQMQKYGAAEGFGVLSDGVKQVRDGKATEFGIYTSQQSGLWTEKETFQQEVPLSKDKMKGGSAFRVYLLSTTIGATRTDTLISGDVGKSSRYLGNKRNNFIFENISLSFVENASAPQTISSDTSAPSVSVAMKEDETTGGMKYQFTVTDTGTGIDFSSISAVVDGLALTPGNGLSLVTKEYTNQSKPPMLSKAIFETGVVKSSAQLGTFTVKDYAKNRYQAMPTIVRDKTAPTLGDVKLSSQSNFSTTYAASESFWYNKRQYISASASDNIGISANGYGIYYYDAGGKQVTVPSRFEGNRISSQSALGTGLYYIWARDQEGNQNVITFNVLVDEVSAEGLEIVIDENIVKPGEEYNGSWQKGNVVIQNTVTQFGNSFGRMYYATSDTDFRDSYQTNPNLQWFAMDVEVRDGKLVLSETITTATKKYYAFKYVAGSASHPGANDNATVYKYLGLIKIDREEPAIAVGAYQILEKSGGDPATWTKAGINSAEWTKNDLVFEITGSTGISKGHLEFTLNGVNAEDSLWYRPGDAGYAIFYYNYKTNRYTQEFSEEDCYNPNNTAKTSFDYKAYLVLTGHNSGNTYAFRFVNGANSKVVSNLGVSGDGRDLGFKVSIDKIAPEVTSINSSWQPNETKSQIYIRESDSGIRGVTVFKQQVDGQGNGIFVDGVPQYQATGIGAENTNGRWYFTFGGVYYKIVVEDIAGNIGMREVKLKIDTRNPSVSLGDNSPDYSNRYVAPGTATEQEKLGIGVWSYLDANGEAFVEFRFTVSGGISGYTFAYSKVGFTTIENEWIKPGGEYDVGELEENQGGYTYSFAFRVRSDRVETYLFRFTSGAQKSVYYNFATDAAEPYQSANEDKYNYRVNIDATAATADTFEFVKNGQWVPYAQYDDSNWVTAKAVEIRFDAIETVIEGASTGLGKVTYLRGSGSETELTVGEDGKYHFFIDDTQVYIVRVYDKAGNMSEYVFESKKIDIIPPTITITATTEDDAEYTSDNATKQSVRISYALDYGDSGILSLLLSKGGVDTVYTEDELLTGILYEEDFRGIVKLVFTNGAGIVATHEFELNIDKTVPIVTVDGLPNGFTTDTVTLTIGIEDNEGGSGIASAYLSYIGDNDEGQNISITNGYSFEVKDWREYTVTLTDNAGNVTEHTFSATVDATVPAEFALDYGDYTPGTWSTAALALTFNAKFATVGGVTNYGRIEYRADGGEWQTLFLAEDYVDGGHKDHYVYMMSGEKNGVYEFRASTLAGKVSENTVTIDTLMLDTVTPELTAVGRIGGEDGREFVKNTEKGYTWIDEDVAVTFAYTLGISGGKVVREFSADGTEGSYTAITLGENLTGDDEAGTIKYTVSEEGYYRFRLSAYADLSDGASKVVDYGRIRRDEKMPEIMVTAEQVADNGTVFAYTLASWTKQNVVLTVKLVLGASYDDAVLYVSKGDSVPDYKPASEHGFTKESTTDLGNGLYQVVYKVTLTENVMTNYDFRITSGAGISRNEQIRRAGGAIRIDKTSPILTIESVVANGQAYARLENGNWVFANNSNDGWTNQNVTLTFLVRTYLSGGTLKYTYLGLAGFTSDNIASYGSPISGAGYTERRYTLTLSGENTAMNADLRFRVESGSGAYTEENGASTVKIKIDKTKPAIDENSIVKTPAVPPNTFTSQDVTIKFEVFDTEILGIASGIREVVIGHMSGSVFVPENTVANPNGVVSPDNNVYSITLTDNRVYLVRIYDNAGNFSERQFKENIDKTEPVIDVHSDYVSGTLATSPITFTFKNSVVGHSGAKAQYRLGENGEWIDAVDYNASFVFNENIFEGDLYFRLVSGSGVLSATTKILVNQDLNDYAVTVTQRVVAEGSYADSINYVKNGTGTPTVPVMKMGETLTVQISEAANFPLKAIRVNGAPIEVQIVNGRKVFSVTVTGAMSVEMDFKEIVSATFDLPMMKQSIRVVDGKNTVVKQPFAITGSRPGFGYSVLYRQIKDEYGNAVGDGKVSASVPQVLGVYRIEFVVTGDYTSVYEFSSESAGKELTVYYFDKTTTANVSFYSVQSAYDLAYIRYSLADGIEFRQTKDLTVTAGVAAANGGDWTVGNMTRGVYNGANYKITIAKMATDAKSVFGAIAQGATVKNIGFVFSSTVVNVADGATFAPIASAVAGRLQNVYAVGLLIATGTNGNIAGIAGEILVGGIVSNVYGGLKIDVTGMSGAVFASGITYRNAGSLNTVFSTGSVTGGANLEGGSMLAYTGNGTYEKAVTLASAIYRGTEILTDGAVADKTNVAVVKYWELNDNTKSYWDTPILAETLSPKTDAVILKTLVDAELKGLKFEVDQNGEHYIAVSSYEAFAAIDNFPWADYRQTADIDAAGRPLSIAKKTPFSGIFDGKGFVIKNVTVTDPAAVQDGYGLFGNVTGVIRNVVLKEMTFKVSVIPSSNAVVGGLVKNLVGGTVENVSVGGTIIAGVPGGTLTVGGVVGTAKKGAKIDKILNTASVTTNALTNMLYVGSIVGTVSESSVTNVYSIAKVDAYFTKRAAVGQLIGMIHAGGAPIADGGYSVEGVTYQNGVANDVVIGYDEANVATAKFDFIPFSEMMDVATHPDFTVGNKHIGVTLKTLFPFAKGSGVESDPFEISTTEEFLLIGNYLYAHYKVMKDIDFGGKFVTIGKGMKFTGSIRGVNSAMDTVRKLTGVTDALIDNNFGTVSSLEIRASIKKSVAKDSTFGAVANFNYGTISFVKANGTLDLFGEGIASLTVGGIAGSNIGGNISNSNADFRAKLSAPIIKFGGIAGTSMGGKLFKNIVQGTMNATILQGVVGMLAGTLKDTEVTREMNSSGVAIDIFLTAMINGKAVPPSELYNFYI